MQMHQTLVEYKPRGGPHGIIVRMKSGMGGIITRSNDPHTPHMRCELTADT